LFSGDANNGGATALTTVASTSASYRGYRQGLDDYRAWLEAHTDARPGYYISGSAVATPHAVLERGLLAGYPFALTPMDKDFTNGWAVTASDNNLGNLRLTIAGPKSPPSAWEKKIRVAIFGHSNPSYCIDQHLDKTGADNYSGGSGLRRLHGYKGTATRLRSRLGRCKDYYDACVRCRRTSVGLFVRAGRPDVRSLGPSLLG